ncbi:hypothetical protein CHS0354_007455 [Potamilus streckersoni]|uniref:protein-histidine N-methyltransferase n=1 Tax=Potamilus streckersoni TaxID=2493646 RepID=A0AAE0SVL3_9BIVA|nr:hypothetical protein CHS0354_007455 [Potamilus streckersoni]
MGRKNKHKQKSQSTKASAVPETKELPKSAKKEIQDHVKSLLEKCSQPPSTGAREFEEFLEIRELIENIRKLQTDQCLPPTRRPEAFPAFISWLQGHSVSTEKIRLHEFEGYGYGLQATAELKEGDMFLAVPRKTMMTAASAQSTVLSQLILEDKILQVMPSVALALHLLCEKRSQDSPWKPYIDTLPEEYSTPLYFTVEDLEYLKGSPALSDCISQYRNIARQYAYFYRLLQNETPATTCLPIKDCFIYDDYRWAVSTVMTRQNQIPTPDGSKMTFALIPLWDMCNHCNGLITTDFSLEKDCSECFALRDFQKDEQIFIFYGARSNAELLVHNGFVYPENEHDRIAIKLGISKEDPLFQLKSELLTRCGLITSRTFYLHTGSIPVDSDLIIFLRIFCMDEENLRRYFSTADASELRQTLGDLEKYVSIETEEKAWSFLETRAKLLLKAYVTSIQEDEELLKTNSLSQNATLAVKLRCCEKGILQLVVEYASTRMKSLQSQS